MPEPDDTRQNPDPYRQQPYGGQPSGGGQWQFPRSDEPSSGQWPATPPSGQPGGQTAYGGPPQGWGQQGPMGQPGQQHHTGPQPAFQQHTGPQPAFQQPAGQPPRRRTGTVLLAVAAVLFLAAAIALGALYVTERQAHGRTQDTVTNQRSQLTGVQQELDSTKGKLTAAEQATREQQNRNAELQKCVDATGAFFEALRADDQVRGEQAIEAMIEDC